MGTNSRKSRLWQLAGAAIILAAVAIVITSITATQAGGKNESQVKLTATASAIDGEGKQTITVLMAVNAGWHAYANPVQNEDFEPNKTIVQVASGAKLEAVKVDYPKGQKHITGMETYYVYEGTQEIKAHIRRVAGDTGPLAVTVKFVTCNDKQGVCLPPETVKLEVK